MVPERKAKISLTEDELLAANLEALGVRGARVGLPESSFDRVFDAYVEVIRRTGRLVTAVDVADHTGLCNARVSLVARELFKAGRMQKLVDHSTGKTVYVPIVPPTPAAGRKATG